MEAHFPQSSDTRLHAKMWDRVEELYCEYITQGSVVMMVDANAHTGANGDHRKDRAGKMLRRRAKKMHLTIINHTSMCKVVDDRKEERDPEQNNHRLCNGLSITGGKGKAPADGADTWVGSQDADT